MPALRLALITALVVAILAAEPLPAGAGGILPAGLDARPVRSPVSDVEYLTVQRRRGAVLVERVSGGGSVLRTLPLRKRFRVPAIAYDNSMGGLSADGRRLVLITLRRRSARRVTELAVVDVERMLLTSVLRLHGDFSFHALSPDARQLYVVQYAPWDVSTYGIRVFEIPERRLRPGSVSEPAGSGAAMRGVPLTQASGPAGRWHYTLYGVRGRPYLYSLDTVRRRAFRTVVDRPSRRSPSLWRVRLQPSRGAVSLVLGDAVLARVDTRTHRLVEPKATRAPRDEDAGTSWLPLAAPTAALLLLAAFTRRRLRQSSDDHQARLRRRSVTGR